MPLITHSTLPALARLAAEGLPVSDGEGWSGPTLRVALVNTMADGALEATERQFLRLLVAAAPNTGVVLDVIGLPEIPRKARARRHCDTHYDSLATARRRRYDALIVTGANIADPDLDRLFYRDALAAVLDWAEAEIPTTLYSCLATHAVLHFRHGKRRRLLADKRWGVFEHRITTPEHPLVAGLSAMPHIPHSRWNEVPRADFEAAGLQVLMDDVQDGGVHLAASSDGRSVFMQGHPEYEPLSLLKEHKREVELFAAGQRADYPGTPYGTVEKAGLALLANHRLEVEEACRTGGSLPLYPEEAVGPHLREVWWQDTARMFSNWLAR